MRWLSYLMCFICFGAVAGHEWLGWWESLGDTMTWADGYLIWGFIYLWVDIVARDR